MHFVENVKNIVWQNCKKLFYNFAQNCKILEMKSYQLRFVSMIVDFQNEIKKIQKIGVDSDFIFDILQFCAKL